MVCDKSIVLFVCKTHDSRHSLLNVCALKHTVVDSSARCNGEKAAGITRRAKD